MIKELNDSIFEVEIGQGYSVVDFWAAWCGPCRAQAPILEDLAQEMQNKAKFFKVNVDENPYLAEKFGISSIPTLLIFKDGSLVNRAVGLHTKAQLASLL